MELSKEQNEIIRQITETNNNMLVLGVAGAGKSEVIIRAKEKCPSIMLLGTTGTAAQNIGGYTIHSGLRIGIHNEVRHLDMMEEGRLNAVKKVVIDESSMLRPDLINAVNKRFQKVKGNLLPFGGVQIILFGDLYQLPPIVSGDDHKFFDKFKTPYFFSSINYKNGGFKFFELTKVFRQDNKEFIDILSRVRIGKTTDSDLGILNSRCIKNLDSIDSSVILISTINKVADVKNQKELDKLQTKSSNFYAKIKGKYPKALYPTDEDITIKEGSRVMTTVNFQHFRNGSLGTVKKVNPCWLEVEFDNGSTHIVEPYEFKLQDNGETIATFTQIPIKLGWAISIHKSQGKTFEKVIIHTGNGAFAGGQMYVALSRCKTLEGMYLVQEVTKRDIFINEDIEKFLEYNRI